MTFPESLKNPSSKMLRQFAVGWLIFFSAWGGRAFWRGQNNAGMVCLAVALLGLALYWLAPAVFRAVFRFWMTVAFPMGWIISQVALAVIFYLAITPLAFFLRLTGRDRLQRRRAPSAQSYWKIKTGPSSVDRYFRPY